MKILSWDVGIYNLSYCILEKNETDGKINIIKWDIVNLVDNDKMKKNKTELFENIPIKLQEINELLNVDYVVIENQPSLKNPQMKSIQMILYSYFIILGKAVNFGEFKNIKNIDFCSASNKLKVYDGPKIVFQEKVKKPPLTFLHRFGPGKYLHTPLKITLKIQKSDFFGLWSRSFVNFFHDTFAASFWYKICGK